MDTLQTLLVLLGIVVIAGAVGAGVVFILNPLKK